MRYCRLLSTSVAALAILFGACSGSDGPGPAGTGGKAGTTGSGGAPGTGGMTGSGGATGSGGSVGSGGSTGSGGSGSGGTVGTGGKPGSGGATGQGGSGDGGTSAVGGKTGTGGRTASGGTTTTGTGGGPGAGGSTAAGGVSGTGGGAGSTGPVVNGGPCDIYEAAKTPCVGAYSTVRALYKAYSGPLYQVRLTSNKTTKDIPVLEAGGFADSKVQDDFCTGACTISIIYDQSPQKNDMPVSVKVFWLSNGGTETDAKAAKITVGTHTVYGVKSFGGKGNTYRAPKPKGTAVKEEAEAMYEVVDSTFYNASCCNDFGNAETTGNPDGAATMEAIYFGNNTMFGSGGGKGPWLLADLEAGTFPSDKKDDPSVASLTYPKFATLMLKGFSSARYVLKHADAQTGKFTTQWDGKRPGGYNPMKLQGAIVLGAGGDGSFYSQGIFFEGAITKGSPDDTTVDDAIQANIVAAGYGK